MQHSLKLGGTNYHVKCVIVPGTTPYWKAWVHVSNLVPLLIERPECMSQTWFHSLLKGLSACLKPGTTPYWKAWVPVSNLVPLLIERPECLSQCVEKLIDWCLMPTLTALRSACIDIQWNLSNPTHQGTREMCRIVQDVSTCLIRHTKGPGKCVGLYRMSEPV